MRHIRLFRGKTFQKPIPDAYEKAVRYYYKRRYRRAIRLFQSLYRHPDLSVDRAKVASYLMKCWYNYGDGYLAEKYSLRAVTNSDSEARANLNRAISARLFKRDFRLSSAIVEKLLHDHAEEFLPGELEYFFGIICSDLDDEEVALRYFKVAYERFEFENDPQVYALIRGQYAHILYMTDFTEEALQMCREFERVSRFVSLAEVSFGFSVKAGILEDLNRQREAIASLRKALRFIRKAKMWLEIFEPAYLVRLGRNLLDLGKTNTALETLRKIRYPIKSQSLERDYYYVTAYALFHNTRYAQAIVPFETFLKLLEVDFPDDVRNIEHKKYLAYALVHGGQPERARPFIEDILADSRASEEDRAWFSKLLEKT